MGALVEDYLELTLKELVRKSKNNHNILDTYFNPTKGCFSCLFVASLKLKEACEIRKINPDILISQLD